MAVITTPATGRGSVTGLANSRPIGAMVPALLQEDDFCMRLTAGLDDVLAPVFATLDCWDSYLDPQTTPDDFVDWLASWVGIDVDETWPLPRRRRLIEQAVGLYRIRGTAAGLAAHVALYAGATPEIVESGACTWSQTADTPMPGTPDAALTVRIPGGDGSDVDLRAVQRIVEASRPAHVQFSVEIAGAAAPPDAAVDAPPGDGEVADDAPGAIDLPGSEKVELEAPAPAPEQGWDEAGDEPASEGKEPTD